VLHPLPAAILIFLILTGTASAQSGSHEPRLPSPTDQPSPSEALIQRARTLSATGNFRESAAVWQTVAATEPVVASLAQRESARALLAAGDIDAALRVVTDLGPAAPPDLLLRAADACRGANMPDAALALYLRARQGAGRSAAGDEASLGFAGTLEEQGKALEALDAYRALQRTFHQVSAYEAAETASRRLSTQLGNPSPLTEADYETIVERLVEVAAFRRAVDAQAERLKNFPDSPQRTQIEAAVVQHLYSLRANAEARARGDAFLKQYPDSAQAHDVFITVFRLDVREGRTAEVERRGRAIMTGQVQGTTLADRQGAARLLAEYLVSVGQPSKALGVYDQLYKMTSARPARVDVLWRMAIASLRAGNRSRATKELQQVLRLKPDSETERAALYWLAFAQDAAGSTTAAKSQWESLARVQPFTYYGDRAAKKIGATPPPATQTFPDVSLNPAVTDHPDYRAAALLSRAGMVADAAVYARRLNGAFRKDDAVALLTARAAEAAGDYGSASTLMSAHFGQYLQRPANNLPPDFWELAYPLAYWTEISAAAARHKVDPLLMLGLSRQESRFDPTARSPVGAVGLFQVMPYTAVELDPSLSQGKALERLVQPEVSAELAAMLIASLQTRYAGELAPTIASYNADRERVQVWWEAAKGLPEELFIDSIPYQQTRAYVRQVLANYEMYRRSAQSASPQK
jgi:soluble lytic murein transglycosylase-like protein